MKSQNISFAMDRRRLIANCSDAYALLKADGKNISKTQRLGKEFAATNLSKSGLRGLESLAWSTDSVADILDYIKIRVGRGTWSTGQGLADILEVLLDDKEVAEFFKQHQVDETQKRQLHLDLCREFIKHLVAHFEFEKSGVGHE
jgi:hypothetical protein